MKTTDTRLQGPEKYETSNINARAAVLVIDSWILELISSLVFGAWCFVL
jgi:hypothetical protein